MDTRDPHDAPLDEAEDILRSAQHDAALALIRARRPAVEAELGIGKADRLPGPRVGITLRREDDEPQVLVRFETVIKGPQGADPWQVVNGTIARDAEGRPVVSDLRLRFEYGTGDAVAALGHLPIKRIVAKTIALLGEAPLRVGAFAMTVPQGVVEANEEALSTLTRRAKEAAGMLPSAGPTADEDAELRAIALAYLAAQAEPGRDVYASMMARLGLSRSQARYGVKRAEVAEWLSKAEHQGRRGRAPGRRLLNTPIDGGTGR